MNSTARPDIPDHLAHRPIWHGLVIPWVAAWSSEGIITVANDPIAGRVAVFTKGRQGRGRPVFGVMNPPRQRAAVLTGLCQICGRSLEDTGWLPNHPKLVESFDDKGGQWLLEPPCCQPCALYSTAACPGIRGTVTDLIEVIEIQPVAQLLDLTDFIGRLSERFDDQETPESHARLNRVMRRYPGGVMGLVRYQITQSQRHDL